MHIFFYRAIFICATKCLRFRPVCQVSEWIYIGKATCSFLVEEKNSKKTWKIRESSNFFFNHLQYVAMGSPTFWHARSKCTDFWVAKCPTHCNNMFTCSGDWLCLSENGVHSAHYNSLSSLEMAILCSGKSTVPLFMTNDQPPTFVTSPLRVFFGQTP